MPSLDRTDFSPNAYASIFSDAKEPKKKQVRMSMSSQRASKESKPSKRFIDDDSTIGPIAINVQAMASERSLPRSASERSLASGRSRSSQRTVRASVRAAEEIDRFMRQYSASTGIDLFTDHDIDGDGKKSILHPSSTFNQFMGVVIVMSIICLTVEVEGRYGDAVPTWLRVWDLTLLSIFFIEMVIRVYMLRGRWIHDLWSVFDAFLVFVGIMSFAMEEAFSDNDVLDAKSMSYLRTLKLARLLRLLRFIPMFRSLTLLVTALKESMKALFWTFLLLSGVLFGVAIFMTESCGNSRDTNFRDPRVKTEWFGSVAKSIFTLFQALTLDDWQTVARSVIREKPHHVITFVVFIFVTAYGLMSMLMAVLVEHVHAAAVASQEERVKMAAIERERRMRYLVKLFTQLDSDCDGVLSIEELRQGIQQDEKIRKSMEDELGVSRYDMVEIVRVFTETAGEEMVLDLDEFVIRFMSLLGTEDSGRMDTAATFLAVRQLYRDVGLIQEELDGLRTVMQKSYRAAYLALKLRRNKKRRLRSGNARATVTDSLAISSELLNHNDIV